MLQGRHPDGCARCALIMLDVGLGRRYVSSNGEQFMHRSSVRVPMTLVLQVRYQATCCAILQWRVHSLGRHVADLHWRRRVRYPYAPVWRGGGSVGPLPSC